MRLIPAHYGNIAACALITVAVLCAVAPPVSAQTPASGQQDPRLTRPLFLDGPLPSRTGRFPTPITDPVIRRTRNVRVDWRLMRHWEDGSVKRMRMNLFRDADYPTALVRTVRRAPDSVSYVGSLEGVEDSRVFVAVHKDAMAAVVQIPRLRLMYRVESSTNGVHRVIEENEANIPECATGPGQHVELPRPPSFDIQPAGDAPVIDVLLLYTDVARAAAGGAEGMQAQAQLAIDSCNTAYANSGITARVRLAGAVEVAYDEVGTYSQHLNRLTNPRDGVMDDVAALRDQYQADMVALIVEDNASCGIGWVMENLTPLFASYAYCVVSRGCAASYWSLAHELGHNMGSLHDRANSTGTPIQPWAYGHRFTGQDGIQYRTIMAYAPGRRIPYFSNPDILYRGQPTGVPRGDPNAADNVSVINGTAPVIAAFRAALPPQVPFNRNDAGRALELAAGLNAAALTDITRFNVEDAPAAALDIADALRISRKSAGLDANP